MTNSLFIVPLLLPAPPEIMEADLLRDLEKDNLNEVVETLQKLSLVKSYENLEIYDPISKFLELTGNDEENLRLQTELARCIAEVTKGEVQRAKFTDKSVISCLLSNISKSRDKPDEIELIIQSCRALGNICFMNDQARAIMSSCDGDEILQSLLEFGNDNSTYFKVRCGLISNYLLGGEEFSKKCMDLGLLEKLERMVGEAACKETLNEDLLMNILPPLSILTENVSDLNFDEKLNRNLAQILSKSTSPELGEMCLELLHYQAENDDVKMVLAKEGLCQSIFELLEKNKDLASNDAARALMKLACDLIVLILTGDDSMNYLYSTKLVQNMEKWLDSNDPDLVSTGVLSLGNFARTDRHCIDLVERKIVTKLLEILAKNNSVEGDMRLQHALLSTLRNLVIPKVNKTAVIEAGLVETILPMLEVHQPPVVFKLLGTLRMTVDGQEKLALELLKNKNLIERLVQWSQSADFAGVTGESQRLMAWLVKHAYLHKFHRGGDNSPPNASPNFEAENSSLFEFVQVPGTVPCMVSMLSSQHMVMQNEALIALTILSVNFLHRNPDEVQLTEQFIKAGLGQTMATFVQTHSEAMTKEVVDNLKTLVGILRRQDEVAKHLDEHNMEDLLKCVPQIVEYCTL